MMIEADRMTLHPIALGYVRKAVFTVILLSTSLASLASWTRVWDCFSTPQASFPSLVAYPEIIDVGRDACRDGFADADVPGGWRCRRLEHILRRWLDLLIRLSTFRDRLQLQLFLSHWVLHGGNGN